MSEQNQNQAGDFNWDDLNDKGFGSAYKDEEVAEMQAMYDETLVDISEKQVVKGKVVGTTDKDVILNIGFKSDGLVPLTEFRDVEGINIGDEHEVYIETQEDKLGQLILSRKKAKLVRAWQANRKQLRERYHSGRCS